MSGNVFQHGGFASEGLSADLARERLLAGVNPKMNLKLVRLLEHLLTDLAALDFVAGLGDREPLSSLTSLADRTD